MVQSSPAPPCSFLDLDSSPGTFSMFKCFKLLSYSSNDDTFLQVSKMKSHPVVAEKADDLLNLAGKYFVEVGSFCKFPIKVSVKIKGSNMTSGVIQLI